jgi:hypothetical protein
VRITPPWMLSTSKRAPEFCASASFGKFHTRATEKA